MIKSIKLSVIAVISAVSIVGCGSSSSSSDVKTGVGYYIDNAVQGIDYVCGSKTGKTDSKGAFTFEEGKDCKFTLAGIPLRTTQADELKDGGKVLEDNVKVAKLLQSIDADNNLDNGIQITDAVYTAITDVLKDKNSTDVVNDDTVLTDVIAYVGDKVEGVDGNVRTDEQVQEHLTQTQTEITKQLLAGKTFYFVSDVMIESDTFNADVTSLTWKNIEGKGDENQVLGSSGTVSIQEIVGKQVTFSDGGSFHIIKTNDTQFITQDDNSGEQRKYYLDYKDAKAQYDSLQGETAPTQTENTKKLFAGKTFYLAYNDDGIDTIEKLVFNNDVSSMTDEVILGNDKGDLSTMSIQIDGKKIILDNNMTRNILESTDQYIKVDNPDGGHDSLLFYNQTDAQASLDGQNRGGTSEGGGTPPSTLSDKIVGKTYYVAARDSYVDENGTTVNNDHVEKLVFDTSGKLYDTWTENDTQQEAIMNYSINDEILSIVTQNDGTRTFTYKGESSTYISFTDGDKKESSWLFFTYEDAEKAFTEPVK